MDDSRAIKYYFDPKVDSYKVELAYVNFKHKKSSPVTILNYIYRTYETYILKFNSQPV